MQSHDLYQSVWCKICDGVVVGVVVVVVVIVVAVGGGGGTV